MFEIRYYCLYPDDLILEGPCLQAEEFKDHIEFYSQLKRYEEEKGLPDSRTCQDVQYIQGIFQDKDVVSLKVLDQMHQQDNIYIVKIDHKKEEMQVFISTAAIMEIFKRTMQESELLEMQLFQSLCIKDVSVDILDVQMICQQRSKILIVFSKKGYVDFYEFMQDDSENEKPFLIQSSRINFGQMKYNAFQTEANHNELKFIKYSKLLRSEDPQFVANLFEHIYKHREFHLYILLIDHNDKSQSESTEPRMRYY